MNICLIGDSLSSITLAKTLVNNKTKVSMYYKNSKKAPNNNRTISISSDNLDFLEKRVIKIKKNYFGKSIILKFLMKIIITIKY